MRGIVSIISGGIALLLILIGFYFLDNPNQEEAGNVVDPMVKMEELAASSCISCHGTDLAGSGGIPGLLDVGDRLSKEEIVEILKNGTPGGMPANLVSGQEELMADYLLSLGAEPAANEDVSTEEAELEGTAEEEE